MRIEQKLHSVFSSMLPEVAYLTNSSVFNQVSKVTRLDLNWQLLPGFLRVRSLQNNVEQLEKIISISENPHNVIIPTPGKRCWIFKVYTNNSLIYTAYIRFTDSSRLNEWAIKRRNPTIVTN